MGREYTGKARIKTHRPDETHRMGGGGGPSAHGAMARGCPRHMAPWRGGAPCLYGGHCCWKKLPGAKLTQPENRCPLPDGAPAQLAQITNLQVSEKGQTDYSYDMLCLNSSCQIWACVVNYRSETSVGSSRKGCLPTLTFILC